MSPLESARRLDGRRFCMDPRACSIVWNRSDDGQVWVALECRRLRALHGPELLDGVDGHVSLYTLRRCAAAEDLAARRRAHLACLCRSDRLWHGDFVLEVEYSQEDYAWCHIVVTSFLHSAPQPRLRCPGVFRPAGEARVESDLPL